MILMRQKITIRNNDSFAMIIFILSISKANRRFRSGRYRRKLCKVILYSVEK